MPSAFIRAAAVAAALALGLPAQGEQVASPPAPSSVQRPASRGRADAPVMVLGFCSFGSEACARLAVVIHGLLRDFPDQLRYEFRHLATAADVDSPGAYRAALAAGEQGRFWEMHDMLFANQDRLARQDLEGMARQLGLDLERFAAVLDAAARVPLVEMDAEEARRLNIARTPAVFVDGTPVDDPSERGNLERAIRRALSARAPR